MSIANEMKRLAMAFFVLVVASIIALPAVAWGDGVDYRFTGYSSDDLASGKTGTVEMKFPENRPDGLTVDLYRVADVSVDGFTFTSDFKPYVADIEWLKESSSTELDGDWSVVAETLIAHAQADGIKPYKTTKAKDRVASFADLPLGLYMVKTRNVTVDGSTYTFSPAITALPLPASAKTDTLYTVTLDPKGSVAGADRRTMKIVKHWVEAKGSNAASKVKSIEVQLLRDGTKWGDPVTLSADNNWTYEWEDTEGSHEWSASEKAINGSTVVWSRKVTLSEDNTIVLTNTEVSEDTPPGGGNKTPGGGNWSIPQTGQPWWPIPLFLIGSMVSFALARFVSVRRRENESL